MITCLLVTILCVCVCVCVCVPVMDKFVVSVRGYNIAYCLYSVKNIMPP